jgi:glycosyltransferase involved in cell wall biosynthesis
MPNDQQRNPNGRTPRDAGAWARGCQALRVAIVCSWLNQYGGAERVLEVLHGMYPDAPIFTSIHWPQALPPSSRDWDVRPSRLDRLPWIHQHHQWFLPLYPYAFEPFDFSAYDLVLSVSSAFAHGVVIGSRTLHICYCLTPARFLWDYDAYVQREELGSVVRRVLPLIVRRLRRWDRLAADRVDYFVAISQAVRQRIQAIYQREADVIYPPVEVQRFVLSEEQGEHFLIVSRLVPYKRVDLAVRAFSQLGLPLWIIGDGRDRQALERLAAPNVRFLGRCSDEETVRHLQNCRALIFPGEEDFGIAPLEAQAAGRPVVAYGAGGALETVIEGVTGTFFRQPTPEALAEAVRRLQGLQFDAQAIRMHAQQFDRTVFEQRFAGFVQAKYAAFRASLATHPAEVTPPQPRRSGAECRNGETE